MQEITATETPAAPVAEPAYASFSARASAFSVDQTLLILILVLFAVPAFILLGIASMFAWPFFVVFLPTMCSVRIPLGWFYFAMQESSRHQGTFGKRLFGIRVTDMDGKRITLARATARHFGKYVSASIMLIGFIMAAFTEKHQALHDMIAETLVIKKPRKP